MALFHGSIHDYASKGIFKGPHSYPLGIFVDEVIIYTKKPCIMLSMEPVPIGMSTLDPVAIASITAMPLPTAELTTAPTPISQTTTRPTPAGNIEVVTCE